jgi:thiamine transport system substrate-binding protein
MRHFVIFLITVFIGLVAAVFFKVGRESNSPSKSVVRVYAPSSFIAQWGPGPWLKAEFEKTCDCQLEYLDSGDINLLLQRLKMEGSGLGADVVLGLDQYDLEKAQNGFEWKKMDVGPLELNEDIQPWAVKNQFVAYDWGILSFVVRRSEIKQLPSSVDDLLRDEFKGKISLEDPRTSTPGLQFLLWLIQTKGEEETFHFLKQLDPQLIGYAPSWSAAYGLFQKGQAKAVFSYVTSPVYHLVQEKTTDVIALELKEQHPVQIEFVGQPAQCRSCDLGQQFVKLMLRKEGQKTIMEKNYMFPVLKNVKEGTPFESVPRVKILDSNVIPSIAERERILKRWSEFRRAN